MFKVHGRVKTGGAVKPLSVVEDCEAVEDRTFRLRAGGEDVIADEFALEHGL